MSKWMIPVLAACLVACGGASPPAPVDPMSRVDADELFDRGLRARQAGDGARAEQYLIAAMERGVPADLALPVLLAVCLETDRYDTALHYARVHLHAHPRDWALRYLVASLHYAVGEDLRARRELERVIEESPERPEPHFLLGILASERLREPRLARASFRRYLDLAPDGDNAAEARRYLRDARRARRR